MPYATFHIDTSKGKIVRQGLERLRRKLPLIGRQRLYDTARLMVKDLSPDNAPLPTYPINWDSLMQARMFMITGGFGEGIPHVRSGRRTKWKVVPVENGYRLVNSNPRAVHIYGNAYGLGQSNIHAGRWPLFRDVMDARLSRLPQKVEDAITMVARRDGIGD